MILVTHGLIGAAVGRLFPDAPAMSFVTGLISHFITDAIPHWHYPLFSLKRDTANPMNNDMSFGWKFMMDVVDIGIDCLAGIVLPILIFQGWGGLSHPSAPVLWGAIGAILPDLFQFVYMKWRKGFLVKLQYFHMWIHSKIEIDDLHFTGISTQLVLMGIFILLSRSLL